jgi:hypothetical protein
MLSELDILKDVCARLEKARIEYIAYLRQWAPALNVDDLLEGCLRERHEP